MSGGNGSDGSSRDARSSYSNSIDSKDSSKNLANDALFGSLYKTYRHVETGVTPGGIPKFNGVVPDSEVNEYLIDSIHVGSTNVDAISENLAEIDIQEQRETNAACSFDTVYSPYSTYFGKYEIDNSGVILVDSGVVTETTVANSGGIPHFEVPTNKTEPNSLTLNPFNPNNALSLYYGNGNSVLFQESFADSENPTNEETAKHCDLSGWADLGHNISWATNGTGQFYDLSFEDQYFNDTTGRISASGVESGGDYQKHVEVENIRAVGFRSPMVLTGWGFDVNGRPVPNEKPDEPTDTFASGAFYKPSNWKSGPIDLRWDDERKVWAAGTSTKIFLVKTTNVSNPAHFSYEVDRSDSRSQFTRFGPDAGLKTFDKDAVIHDPENIAYTANTDNIGAYEQLNYGGIEYPHYEAFIIRETKDETDSNTYYNIWTDDCNDCGHITNSGCGTQHESASKDKKILIENPLRQSLEVGDLAFTVKTGRKEKVNTGTFSGGTGTGASARIVVDEYGAASGEVLSSGSDYGLGAIGIVQGDICVDLSLVFETGVLTTINIGGVTTGFSPGFYLVDIISTDAIAQTEELDIHWILQAEFKSQQIVTHVECEGGLLQSCSMKIQTQGFKTCEWCGEDTTFINAF